MVENLKKWSFDNMSEPYDAHLSRSIPLYKESQFFIQKLSSFYVKDRHINYEIGCANGTIIGDLAKLYLNFLNTKFVGIDLSSNLIDEAKERYKEVPNLEFIQGNASAYKFKQCNLAIIHYCLQFMTMEEKNTLLSSLYKNLIESGAVIIFEKTLLPDSYSQEVFSAIHTDFKFDKDYSAREVIDKSVSLRAVMRASSTSDNIVFFKSIGFKSIYTFFKWGPFEGYLCVK